MSAGPAGVLIDAKRTHQEMAGQIGCTRETVSTILGQFRKQGLIHVNGRAITILDPDAVCQKVASTSAVSRGS